MTCQSLFREVCSSREVIALSHLSFPGRNNQSPLPSQAKEVGLKKSGSLAAGGENDSVRSESYQLGPSDLLIPGHQGNAVSDAGGCNHLVRGVARKVQFRRFVANRHVQRPDMNSGENLRKLRRPDVQGNAAQFRELSQFPVNESGDAPRLRGEQRPFGRL